MTSTTAALIALCVAFIALLVLSRWTDMPPWEVAYRLVVGGAFLALAAVAYAVIWIVQGFTGREVEE